MKKLYIFDLDGTLVNSLFDLADSMNNVLEKHGFPLHETDEYKYFVGNGTLKLVERAIPESERNEEKIKAIHAEFSDEYKKRAIEKTKPYAGINELLKKLKGQGCFIAVASNKPDQFSRFIVETLFGNDTFDLVSGKKEGVPAKPAPDIILDIMDKLGADRDSTVLSGDSDVDVMTAHNAGIECIGCTWGFRGEQELRSAGADYIAYDPMEIINLV